MLLEVSKHVASKWIFEGFGAFTLLTAVMLLWGIKDIIRGLKPCSEVPYPLVVTIRSSKAVLGHRSTADPQIRLACK